jgi:hypothetical protein
MTSLLAMELNDFEQCYKPDRHNTVSTNLGTTSSPPPSPPPPPPDSPCDPNEPPSFFSSLLDDKDAEDDKDTDGVHEFTSGTFSDEPLVSFVTLLSFSRASPLASVPRHQNDEPDYDEPPDYDECSLLYESDSDESDSDESDSDAHEFSYDEDYPQFAATGDGHAYSQHHDPSTKHWVPFPLKELLMI